jgi:cobalt/nickel transport system permease protein
VYASIAGIAAGAGGIGPADLHAPDGFLSVPIAALMWLVTIAVTAYAVKRTNATFDERAIPLMGVTAAFIFAAQMFNFQVIGGTSGHLLGGVLAAVLLGPWAGTLVMVAVVAVQGLVFQDGGLVVMGANIFNMGIVGTLGGYAVYRALCSVLGGEQRARIPAAGIAAWLSVFVAAGAMAIRHHGPRRGPRGDAGDPRPDRHRRGAHHDGRPRVRPGHPARPPGPAGRAPRSGRLRESR